MFNYGAFLNPVLYVEYENLHPDHKYLLDVSALDPEQTFRPVRNERTASDT